MGINKQYQNSNPSIDREAPDPNLAPCHIGFPTKGFSFNQKNIEIDLKFMKLLR